MIEPAWNTLVHFVDEEQERTKVVPVFETPVVGEELVGDIPRRWIVEDVKHHGAEEREGQTISVEVWVKRAAH